MSILSERRASSGMKQITTYMGKKVLVLGLAKSGFNAAKLLKRLGADVTVSDVQPLDKNPEARELQAAGFKVITGEQTPELLDAGYDLMIKNPGIPYDVPVVQRAQALHLPILGSSPLENPFSYL